CKTCNWSGYFSLYDPCPICDHINQKEIDPATLRPISPIENKFDNKLNFQHYPQDQQPGTKYDGEKLQYTLIPPYAMQEIARNLTVGLRKYKERNNWQKVPNATQRYMDALYRHLEAIRRGEIYDKESGAENMPHMAAVAVNAMFLLEFMLDPNL